MPLLAECLDRCCFLLALLTLSFVIAGTTFAGASVYARVNCIKRMAIPAMSLLDVDATERVLGEQHRFKVGELAACSVAAKMIYVQLRRQRSVVALVPPAMRLDELYFAVDLAEVEPAVSLVEVPCPLKAPAALEPVIGDSQPSQKLLIEVERPCHAKLILVQTRTWDYSRTPKIIRVSDQR
jgi:hypothetical protein